MRFVSAKQLIFPFGIERIPPFPDLADPGVTRAVEEFPQRPQFICVVRGTGLALAPLRQHVGNEARQALVGLAASTRALRARSSGRVMVTFFMTRISCFRVSVSRLQTLVAIVRPG